MSGVHVLCDSKSTDSWAFTFKLTCQKTDGLREQDGDDQPIIAFSSFLLALFIGHRILVATLPALAFFRYQEGALQIDSLHARPTSTTY